MEKGGDGQGSQNEKQSQMETENHSPDLTPYTGRWVALVDNQIAGVGDTGVAARNLARRNRPKRKIKVQYVPDMSGEPLTLSPLLAELAHALSKLNTPIYLVGGAVRDAILGRVSHDLDFVVPENGIKTAFRLGDILQQPAFVLDQERDVGRIRWAKQGLFLDISTFRGPSLTADLSDRDITFNAMAIPALAQTTAEVIDPLDGMTDLADKKIAITHPHALSDDPIRALRAIRMMVRYEGSLTPETATAVQEALPLLNQVSAERQRDELLNLLTDAPEIALKKLYELAGLDKVLPRIAALAPIEQSKPHHENVLFHTFSILRWLPTVLDQHLHSNQAPFATKLRAHLARPVTGMVTGLDLLRLAALYHDVGKADTQTIEENGRIRFFDHDTVGATITEERLTEFRFSREAVTHVTSIVHGHMRPLLLATSDTVSVKARHRFFRRYGHAGLDICLISLADHLATYNGISDDTSWAKINTIVTDLLAHYYQFEDPAIQVAPFLNGRDIMEILGSSGGPQIGKLLRLLRESQIAGDIKTKDEAIHFIQQSSPIP